MNPNPQTTDRIIEEHAANKYRLAESVWRWQMLALAELVALAMAVAALVAQAIG